MNKRLYACLILVLCAILNATVADAQRRARPGSMRHSEAEIAARMKVTKLSCRYIKDGATFEGPIYMTGEVGGIKIGDAIITFSKGHYLLSFDAAKFKVKKHSYMTDEERRRKGISQYEYENAWEHKKLGQDFDYGGKYATIEQYGSKWLILYQGDSDSIYAKIPINSISDSSFELSEDDIYVKMKYVR